MKKPNGKIDWITSEEDEIWQASEKRIPSTLPRSWLQGRAATLAFPAVALLLLLIAAWSSLRPATAKPSANDLHSAHLQSEEALTQTLEALNANLHVDTMQRFGDHIMAQVTVSYAEDGNRRAYRETHFYQKSDATWQRIPSDPTLLGPQKTLQIANFTILYRDVDADAVYESAPKLEQLYATLRHDFGVSVATAASAYTIEVTTARVQGLYSYNTLLHEMTLTSPILLSAPAEITPATLLYQETVYPLTRLLILGKVNDAATNPFVHWPALESALPLWELWSAGSPLASGHEDVIRWLYHNSQSATNRRPIPDGYAALCRAYRIWQLTPTDLWIPLTCSKEDTTVLSADRYPALAATWPQQINDPSQGAPLLPSTISAPLTVESILDYIVATYGRDKLPQLLEALGNHTSPDTLIPALFGVPRADFENAWQTYLAQHY